MRTALLTFTLLAAGGAAALAATPSPTQVHAAKMATQQAQDFLIKLDSHDAAAKGATVQLHQIGRTHTRISVHLPHPEPGYHLGLYQGSDCGDNRLASARGAIPLNNFSSAQGSSTVVNVPISELRSKNYLLAIEKSTQQHNAVEACGHLNR